MCCLLGNMKLTHHALHEAGDFFVFKSSNMDQINLEVGMDDHLAEVYLCRGSIQSSLLLFYISFLCFGIWYPSGMY